jgi:hypothetical protein
MGADSDPETAAKTSPLNFLCQHGIVSLVASATTEFLRDAGAKQAKLTSLQPCLAIDDPFIIPAFETVSKAKLLIEFSTG